MRTMIIIFFILFASVNAWSLSNTINRNWTIPSPPKDGDPKSAYDYNTSLFSHFNQLQVVTANPNTPGSQNFGQFGDELLYQATGNIYYYVVQTTSPSGKTWSGVKLGSF